MLTGTKYHNDQRPGSDTARKKHYEEKLGGVRGKYATHYRTITNLVPVSPDVAEYFPDERTVNTALHALIPAARRSPKRMR